MLRDVFGPETRDACGISTLGGFKSYENHPFNHRLSVRLFAAWLREHAVDTAIISLRWQHGTDDQGQQQ